MYLSILVNEHTIRYKIKAHLESRLVEILLGDLKILVFQIAKGIRTEKELTEWIIEFYTINLSNNSNF